MADLKDSEILAVMRGRSGQMTYVIANCLRMEHRHHNGALDTSSVLRRMEAMEKLGIVERVPSVYARQICWRLVPNALGNRRAAFGASVLTDGLAGKRTE